MLVRVLLSDGTDAMLDSFLLDGLIMSKQVLKLQRSTGWATVGVDRFRVMAKGPYAGYERRRDLLQTAHRRSFLKPRSFWS